MIVRSDLGQGFESEICLHLQRLQSPFTHLTWCRKQMWVARSNCHYIIPKSGTWRAWRLRFGLGLEKCNARVWNVETMPPEVTPKLEYVFSDWISPTSKWLYDRKEFIKDFELWYITTLNTIRSIGL